MKYETIEQFIKRGGKIKKCPEGWAECNFKADKKRQLISKNVNKKFIKTRTSD